VIDGTLTGVEVPQLRSLLSQGLNVDQLILRNAAEWTKLKPSSDG
jgi:hypothetical protein